MTRLFVTAAGTGVGKTFVCCRLLEGLAGRFGVRAVKPVASGFDPGRPADSDTAQLLLAQGREPAPAAIDATTPWRYRAPLSPDMAAAREGERVPFDAVVDWSLLDAGKQLTLIEGIGGACVPLDDSHTVIDWIAAVGAHIWLVAGSYLGSISHTLATLAAIEARGLVVDAIVVSESAEPAAPLAEIAAVIRRFSGTVPVAELGRPPQPAELRRLLELPPLAALRVSADAERG